MRTPSMDKGSKSVQIRTQGLASCRSSVTALWGPRALDYVVDLDLAFDVERDKMSMRRLDPNSAADATLIHVAVKGLVSKFIVGAGRTGTDRQFFFVNGRPCHLDKIQKAFNEVYKSFNATQSAFLVADFIIPTGSCDINVSPDKRTIFLHHEANLIAAFKTALETAFAPARSMYDVSASQMTQTNLPMTFTQARRTNSAKMTDSSSVPTPTMRTSSSSRSSSPVREAEQTRGASDGMRPINATPAAEDDEVLMTTEIDLVEPPQSRCATEGGDKETEPCLHHASALDDPPVSSAASHFTATTVSAPGCNPPLQVQSDDTPSSPPDTMDVELSVAHISWSQSSDLETARRRTSASSSSFQEPTKKAEEEEDVDMPSRKRRRGESETPGAATGLEESAASDVKERDAPGTEVLRTPDTFRQAKDVRSVEGRWFSSGSRKKGTRASASQVSLSSPPANTSSHKAKGEQGLASQISMRSQLVGFAMAGSRRMNDQMGDVTNSTDDANDLADIEDKMQEDDEEMAVDNTLADAYSDRDVENEAEYAPAAEGVPDDAIGDPRDKLSEGDVDIELPRKRIRRRRSSRGDPTIKISEGTPVGVKVEEKAVSPFSEGVIDLISDAEDESASRFGAGSARSSGTNSPDAAAVVSSDDFPAMDEDETEEPEIQRQDSNSGDVVMEVTMERTASACDKLREALFTHGRFQQENTAGGSLDNAFFADAGLANTDDAESAANALARVIEKSDFASMDVVGQFNRGFIIARRRRQSSSQDDPTLDDLFIIDQHASDEKYNFETLQQTTKIESQRLLRPRPLELTAADELIALDRLDVLRQNGFEVEVTKAAPDSDGGARLRLVAQPVSKSTTFDMRDLEELIHLLHDAPGGAAVRCSKARAMFASRACRKSVMIGMPLTKGRMVSVVQHMGTMDQPWNCPHGRPTMRHLIDLDAFAVDVRRARPIDWGALTLSC